MIFVRFRDQVTVLHLPIIKVWLSPAGPPALNLAAMVHRYVRPFTKHDSQHALQYVACMCLSADQTDGVGKEQVEYAWSEVRKIIVLAEGAGWDELVGGLRPDGTRFVSFSDSILKCNLTCDQSGAIEQISSLLLLKDAEDYNEKIVRAAAGMCERERRTLEAIKLYNISGAYQTVAACLAQALGDCVSQPDGGGEEGQKVESTAREIYYHYSRLNRAADEKGMLLRCCCGFARPWPRKSLGDSKLHWRLSSRQTWSPSKATLQG